MKTLPISTILGLVGDLKDNDPAQIRFRDFLEKEIKDIGLLRDFINECLANTGDQYNFAFQDLIIFLGKFLGFGFEYGRYRGAIDTSGHDGIWFTEGGFHVVIEVKKTEAYAIKIESLIGYVDRLISEGKIPSWDHAVGLYVVGKFEPELKHLENAIIAPKRTNQLRVVSADALISFAEITNDFDVSQDDVLAVLKPAKPVIDSTIDLLTRVIQPVEQTAPVPPKPEEKPVSDVIQYWITPVKSTDEETAEECIKKLVGEERIYAFGDKTPGRASIKIDDRICFYATTNGVVANAVVASLPERKPHAKVRNPEQYPWIFKLKEVKLYIENPIVIDAAFRANLDAFRDKDVVGRWAWFVQGTHRVSAADFGLLTRVG
jgi:hypothetical protein